MRAMSRCRGRVFRLITIQSRFLAKATHPHPHPHPATAATLVDQRRDMAGGDVAFAASIPGNPADVTK